MAPPEETTMERIKVIWTFNPITIGSILSAVVAGTIYINTIENKLEATATHVVSIEATLNTMSDIPYRMKVQESLTIAQAAKDSAQNDRIDRIADLVMNGQETMRKDVQAAVDAIRKDIGTLSTKVEVVGSKVDMMTGKPQPSVFMRPK